MSKLINDHIPALRSAETPARVSTTEPDVQQEQYLRLREKENEHDSSSTLSLSMVRPLLLQIRDKVPGFCEHNQILSYLDVTLVLEQTSAEIDRLRGINNELRRSKDSVPSTNLSRDQVEARRGKLYSQECQLSQLKLQITTKDKLLFENSNAISRLEKQNHELLIERLEIGRLRSILQYHRKKFKFSRKEKLPTKIRYPQSIEQDQFNKNFFTVLPFFLTGPNYLGLKNDSIPFFFK